MKKVIYELIKNHPEGMTVEEVAQATGLSFSKAKSFLQIMVNTFEVLELKNYKFFCKKNIDNYWAYGIIVPREEEKR